MFKLLLISLHRSIHQVRIPHQNAMAIQNHGSYPEQATSHKATLQQEHFITKVNPKMKITINLWDLALISKDILLTMTTQTNTAMM